MLLTKNSIINGVKYPRNTKLYGFVSFSSHRIFIDINNIAHNPVKLKVYDAQDGSLGVYTKVNLVGEVSNDVVEDSTDDIKIGNIPVGKTIKKIFKKKQKEPKIEVFNRTKLILN